MCLQIHWGLGETGADDEPQTSVILALQVPGHQGVTEAGLCGVVAW